MLFPTTDFAIFFAVVFTANWLLNPYPRSWKLFMIAASFVFYSWWDWHYVILLAASADVTIACVGAAVLVALRGSPETDRIRRDLLAGLLGLLPGWFKYYTFLAVNVDNLTHRLFGGSLPIPLEGGPAARRDLLLHLHGDQLRGRRLPGASWPWLARSTWRSTFPSFPHLVAGPIVRGEELLPQNPPQARSAQYRCEQGPVWLIAAGLFKKMVVSSYISSAIVDPVFRLSAHPLRTSRSSSRSTGMRSRFTPISAGIPTSPSASPCFSASGSPRNFPTGPYTATSLQGLLASLAGREPSRDGSATTCTSPSAGTRAPESRIARNIMITMILGGLWHRGRLDFHSLGGIPPGWGGVIAGRWRRKRSVALGVEAVPMSRGRVLLARALQPSTSGMPRVGLLQGDEHEPRCSR